MSDELNAALLSSFIAFGAKRIGEHRVKLKGIKYRAAIGCTDVSEEEDDTIILFRHPEGQQLVWTRKADFPNIAGVVGWKIEGWYGDV